MLDSIPNEAISPPGLVILSEYEKLEIKPLSPKGYEKDNPPPLIVTAFPVPFIPLIVGRASPNVVRLSPYPNGELIVVCKTPNCLPNSSL